MTRFAATDEEHSDLHGKQGMRYSMQAITPFGTYFRISAGIGRRI